MNRTEYEIAKDEQDMLNTLLYGVEVLRGLPYPPFGAKKYFENVQAILDRRTERFHARKQEREAALTFPVIQEDAVGELG